MMAILRILLCLAALLSGTVQAAQIGIAPALHDVPHPRLDTLETTVAAQLREARQLLDTALRQSDTPAAALAELYGGLGRLYHAYELFGAAELCYQNAARLDPQAFSWPYYSAVLNQQSGQMDNALRGFLETLLLNPDYLPARLRLAEVYRAVGRPEMAAGLYRKALALHPEEAALLAAWGELLLEQEQPAAAAEYLQATLARVPAANRLHYPLALAYRALGDTERARAHLAERGNVGVTADDPLLAELRALAQGERVRALQGELAYRAGQFEAAVAAFEQALASAPDSIPALVGLGSALAGLNDYPNAMAQFRRVLEIDPQNTAARFNLGVLLLKAGEAEQAIIHLQALVDLDAEDARARLGLANALRRRGRSDEALEHYERAAILQPTLSEAWVGGAGLLYELKRYGEALNVLEQAHKTLPGDGGIAHALARLLAASPEPALRDGARATDLAKRVVQAHPMARHVETLALALAQSGDCAAAADWQRRLIAAAEAEDREAQLEQYRRDLARYAQSPCAPPGE